MKLAIPSDKTLKTILNAIRESILTQAILHSVR